jgi:hypothetical protein
METMRLLREIALSYRRDWSDFDGRAAKRQLYEVATLAEREHAGEDVSTEVSALIAAEKAERIR